MTTFLRYLTLPADFAIAFQTDRPSMLRLIRRPITEEESPYFIEAIQIMFETVQQRDAKITALTGMLERLTEVIRDAAKKSTEYYAIINEIKSLLTEE